MTALERFFDRKRAFALPVVFLVLLLLGVAFVGLADTVVVGGTAAGGRVDRQKKFYVCEGVVRLATGITRDLVLDDPQMDFLDLNAALEPVRRIALEAGIDISAPSHSVEETKVLEEGDLTGLEVISSAASFAVSADPSVGCSFNLSQPLGTISPLQFMAFSIGPGEIPPSVTPFVPFDPGFAWGRTRIAVPPNTREILTSTDEANAPLRLPAPGEGEPPDQRFALARSRTFKPYIQQPFTNNAAHDAERASSRIAYQADIRIIDGEWYVRDPANPLAWPGVPVWADHPCDSDAAPDKLCAATYTDDTAAGRFSDSAPLRRRLYSVYERNSTGIVDDGAQRGVVSYGRILGLEPAVTANAALGCPGGGLKSLSGCGATAQRKKIVVEASHELMADPSGAQLLPINIDVGLLGQALATVVNDEIGASVCIPGAIGCRRPFNGIVYVTSTKGVAPGTGSLPYALCGGADGSVDGGTTAGLFDNQPCASATRYNAVRVFDADNTLAPFASTGLTIATDLPLFLYGDWNTGGAAGGRTLLMADRVSVQSALWRDDGSTAIGGRVNIAGSVIAGWGPSHKLPELLRAVESSVDLRVSGSLVGGFDAANPWGGNPFRTTQWYALPNLVHPANDFQPPGVPRVSLGLPLDIAPNINMGGCGGGA